MRPALIEVDDPTAPIVQQEVFGPVATLEPFDTEDDAVRLANATEYGLAAAVWTRDIDRGARVAANIDAGTVWLNDWAVVHDQFEEGGFKQSGIGRLNGVGSIEDFVETKHIVHNAGLWKAFDHGAVLIRFNVSRDGVVARCNEHGGSRLRTGRRRGFRRSCSCPKGCRSCCDGLYRCLERP